MEPAKVLAALRALAVGHDSRSSSESAGFHRCGSCSNKLPSQDPHQFCLSCLGPGHASEALRNPSSCQICTAFRTRTLKDRLKRARGIYPALASSSCTATSAGVGGHPSGTLTHATAAASSKGSSAGHSLSRSHKRRHRSPSASPPASPPHLQEQHTDKRLMMLQDHMADFMGVVIKQQEMMTSLLLPKEAESSTASCSRPPAAPASLPSASHEVPGRSQRIERLNSGSRTCFSERHQDSVSLEVSGGECAPNALEVKVEPISILSLVTPVSSVEGGGVPPPDDFLSRVGRAAQYLGVPWPEDPEPERSLFHRHTQSAKRSRFLPAFPDYLKEVQASWDKPASGPSTIKLAAQFARFQGADTHGLTSFPVVDPAFAALVSAPPVSTTQRDFVLPNRQCRSTEVFLQKSYAAEAQALRIQNTSSLLAVYVAELADKHKEAPTPEVMREIAGVADTVVDLMKFSARASGRSLAALVAARRQLWLTQTRVPERDKPHLLDAPITPGFTFGPAVEVMLERSRKATGEYQRMVHVIPHQGPTSTAHRPQQGRTPISLPVRPPANWSCPQQMSSHRKKSWRRPSPARFQGPQGGT
ncbi:uncharacterized protein LOC136718009 [Amia ocellicauda]|uniref:uncharacterized protein LOC136718009 n=1 Tax=Amia ocellicauda TaxID=2972642 RepID=UPI003463AAC8